MVLGLSLGQLESWKHCFNIKSVKNRESNSSFVKSKFLIYPTLKITKSHNIYIANYIKIS